MQKYKYTAVNLQNQKIRGTFIAKDERDLAEQLAKQSLYLISSSVYSGATPSAFFTLGTGKVSFNELTTFCRQFAIMLNAHIPLLECIDILRNQSFSSYFQKILDVIYEDVKGGMVLSEALDKHAKVFPDFFRSMVYVGERSGKLDKVFEAIADYYERDAAMKRKMSSAMSYPMMLLVMTVAVAILMLAVIVPIFRDSMKSLNVEPEGITKAVYDLSEYLLVNGGMIIAVVLIIGLIIFGALQTEKGKYAKDVFVLYVPMIRKIQINTITARFARAFALLLSSGMDLSEAMASVEVVMTNRFMKKKFHNAAEQVRLGMSLTNSFEANTLFPSMMTKMVTIGEKTNSLDEVLTRSCTFFDAEVESSLTSFANKIQPIMLVIMAVVVGTLFVAIYSPMLSIMTTLT